MIFEYTYNNKPLIFNIGEMAKQATGSIFVAYGNTDFLVTVTTKKSEEKKDFFPLIVNFEEKLYAVGKIPGNFQRREAKPSEYVTLNARLIDRSIRPLFDENFTDEVMVVVTLLGYDKNFDISMLAIMATSLAIKLAKLPLTELAAGLILGMKKDEIIVAPDFDKRKEIDCELKVAGTKKAINMIEFKGTEQKEEEVLNLLDRAHSEIKTLITIEEEILNKLQIKDTILEVEIEDKTLFTNIKKEYNAQLLEIMRNNQNRHIRGEKIDFLKQIIKEKYLLNIEAKTEEHLICSKEIDKIISELIKENFVDLIVKDKYRLDGRKIDEIRALSSRVDVIKMTHGSALFTRGETQSLGICTLGIKSDEQLLDGLEDITEKRFMLHYNFPPYSVGEVGRMGAPGRREIGHGNLAEKALLPVIPSFEEFPYTIRLVSEILESNGSSSQATICSGTMALLDAGVPIKKHVAGIAMGLIEQGEDFTILSDIAGLEDHLGDMDFKVAGTRDGITAIQMDIKVKGINRQIFKQCFNQAYQGRMKLLDHIENTIKKPNQLADNVLKIISINILPEQIKTVIGRGGEMINKIIDETGVKIDIDDNGKVLIYGENQEMLNRAKELIEKLTKIYKVSEIYQGIVSRVEKYGIFVKFEDQEALVHISDLKLENTEIEKKYSVSDKVEIKLKSIDDKGRIKASIIE